jgi:prevent-host-death family protein
MSQRAVDLNHAQNNLKELVDQAAQGEEVILTQEGEPVAKIIPFSRRGVQRRFGSAKGVITILDSFDEPLEDFSGYR